MCWRETSLSTTSRVLVPIMLSWQCAVVAVEGVAFRPRAVVAWREIVAGCTRIFSQIDHSRKVTRGWGPCNVWSHTYSKSMDQPGKVTNSARCPINRGNSYFPVRVRVCEFDLTRRIRQSRPASACSSPHSGRIWCLRDSSRVPRIAYRRIASSSTM